MTVRGYLDKIKCPTLLVTGEFDPLCPLEDAVEAFDDLKVPKEMWVIENQYHPLWGMPNLGGMDCHDYVLDWLKALVLGQAGARRSAAALPTSRRTATGRGRTASGRRRSDRGRRISNPAARRHVV